GLGLQGEQLAVDRAHALRQVVVLAAGGRGVALAGVHVAVEALEVRAVHESCLWLALEQRTDEPAEGRLGDERRPEMGDELRRPIRARGSRVPITQAEVEERARGERGRQEDP